MGSLARRSGTPGAVVVAPVKAASASQVAAISANRAAMMRSRCTAPLTLSACRPPAAACCLLAETKPTGGWRALHRHGPTACARMRTDEHTRCTLRSRPAVPGSAKAGMRGRRPMHRAVVPGSRGGWREPRAAAPPCSWLAARGRGLRASWLASPAPHCSSAATAWCWWRTSSGRSPAAVRASSAAPQCGCARRRDCPLLVLVLLCLLLAVAWPGY